MAMSNVTRHYYCFVAGLPELASDQQKMAFTVSGFVEEMKENLHPDDFKGVRWILYETDNRNLLGMLMKTAKPFLPGGNISQDEMEEMLKEPESLPGFMNALVMEFRSSGGMEPAGGWENRLADLFYRQALTISNPFLREWFLFNLLLNNITVAYLCRKFKRDPEEELVGENEVVEVMKKSQSRDFGILAEVPFVDRVITILENRNILERERNIDLMRWAFLEEQTTFHYFTVEVILSYLLKLMILDRWLKLDPESGAEKFGKISADFRHFTFSRDFQSHEKNK